MTLSDLETELKALEAHLLILSTKLTVLSYILIFCTAIVVVGLVVEYQPDLREWVTGRPRDRRKGRPTRVGALLVIVGVAGEVGLTFWSFRVESEIKSTNAKIERDLKAEIGILGTSAVNAAASADRANLVAGKASQQSEHARSVAGNAELLARGARQEADSFKNDIVSAKTQAAKAESDLAEALRQAAAATAELQRLKIPRSLINVPGLISNLETFKETEYRLAVAQEDESFGLIKAVDAVLQRSGWKRIPTPVALGIPSIAIDGIGTPIPVCVETGIQIHVREKEPIDVINSRPLSEQTPTIRAAVALRLALSSSIAPPNDDNVGKIILVDKEPGTELPIQICVGKKP